MLRNGFTFSSCNDSNQESEDSFQIRKLPQSKAACIFGSSGKFVFFIAKSGMTGRHGRQLITRDFWSIQELLLQQDGAQTWRGLRGRRAFGQTLCLSWLPQPGGDSPRQKNCLLYTS